MKKKIIIILSIIFIIVVLAVCIPFIINKSKEIKLTNERINSATLMEYVKNHDWEHLKYKYNNNDLNAYETYTMGYLGESFKCDILKSKEIIAIKGNYIFLDDNSIYKFSLENLYSNNQNCLEVNPEINIKQIKNNGEYLIDEDNNLYLFDTYINDKIQLNKIEEKTWGSEIYYNYIRNEEIVDLYIVKNNYNEEKNRRELIVFAIKTDGNLYKQLYVSADTNDYIFESEEIIYNKEKYGHIIDVTYGSSIYDRELNYNVSLDNIQELTIVTDEGFYFLDVVKTNECVKYEDIKCETKMVESDIYKKYSQDVKYIGERYTVLTDNTIIDTSILTYDLDKDVK